LAAAIEFQLLAWRQYNRIAISGNIGEQNADEHRSL
jgi:hypothetical protein